VPAPRNVWAMTHKIKPQSRGKKKEELIRPSEFGPGLPRRKREGGTATVSFSYLLNIGADQEKG